jgi:protein TonB
VDPVYPAFAKANGIEGSVEMKVVIGPDGTVQRVDPVSGQEVLLKAAIEAVRQWRYTPTLLDQKPIEAEVDVTLQFRLPRSN